MKLKMNLLLTVFTAVMLFTNCKKNCGDEIATCKETPPNEACQAYFVRWFYNKNKNQCEQIGYSGCSARGFSTEEECKACECE